MSNFNSKLDSGSLLKNFTFDEIEVGQKASVLKKLTNKDIQVFAVLTGDINPAHVDIEYAESSRFHKIIAHGMWGGSLISTVLGTILPGPGTIYLEQSFKFLKPVTLNDEITATITVVEKKEKHSIVVFDCECTNQKGDPVIQGVAKVIAPKEKIERKKVELGNINLTASSDQYYNDLKKAVKKFPPLKVGIINPTNQSTLEGALEACKEKLIHPVFIGSEKMIHMLAEEFKYDLGSNEIINCDTEAECVETSIKLANEDKVEALMKGNIDTRYLVDKMLHKSEGLQCNRTMSQILIMDIPTYHKHLYITDGAVNIKPNLQEKKDIIQNAVDLFRSVQGGIPKVAIISAVSYVDPDVNSTMEAKALCKMAEHGEITNAIVDGPLSLDNAISEQAAVANGITSTVAGDVDIIVVPDLEAGNILYKECRFLADLEGASIVLGGKVPIIFPSRPSRILTRKISCIFGMLWAYK